MITELIAKKCVNNLDCPLRDQPQDKGLPICPECACELVPIERTNQRLAAAVAVAVLLLTSAAGGLGYGMAIKSLSAGDAIRWLLGRVHIEPGWSGPLLEGGLKMERPGVRFPADSLLCEEREGVNWCRWRPEVKSGDEAWFDLTPRVANLYVFYRGPGRATTLFPTAEVSVAPPGKAIQLPYNQRMRISGPPASETFLVVASEQPVAALAALAANSDISLTQLDEAAISLASGSGTLVVIFEVPHS